MIFERIETLINTCNTVPPDMPSQHCDSDGWMFGLALDLFASIDLKDGRHPLTVPLWSRWYSEALLPPAFLSEFQEDTITESWTHADAFIGHFDIGNGAKRDMTLCSRCQAFCLIEAKMYSKLTASVEKATYCNAGDA